MESYTSFAKVYDLFMNEVPYDLWVDYIEEIWKKYNVKPNLVLDLGCGTGNITCRLSQKGYNMIGLDLSNEMLVEAKQKADELCQNILFLEQDMKELNLYETVESCICTCDCLNYILEEDELLEVFNCVNKYLDTNGIFIFDINTEYKFKNILSSNSFCSVEENASYIWENYYYDNEKINEYYLNFFIKDKDSNKYSRYEECHYQKAYSINNILYLLKKANLKILDVYNAFSFDKPKEDSERVIFVVKN